MFRLLPIIIMLTACFLIGQLFAQGSDTDTGLDWPREIITEKAKIVLYQPQPESLNKDILESRAAISVTVSGIESPVFGAIWLRARIATDFDTRLVSLLELKVTNARFPEGEASDIEKLKQLLETEIPKWDLTWPLDEMLESLEIKDREKKLAEQFNADPPEIIFATEPSVLVLIDGEPILQKIENTGLEYVSNTAFFIVRDGKWYYLQGQGKWYRAEKITSDWQHITEPSSAVKQIADLAKKNQQDEAPEDSALINDNTVPRIFIRTKPAELLQTDGKPDFVPIQGTGLLYMKNTDDDVIMDIDAQLYFILIAGRWYSAPTIEKGPWEFIPNDQLPGDFARIPAGSDMGDVRASVAGTEEANDAVLENSIPQTAAVDRKTAKLSVDYDGDPKFVAIENTTMSYAANTDKSVLKIDSKYYCCDDAIWFVSVSPKGPWEVCAAVPAEVQSIPPDVPVYNVKYVYIYDSTPEVVYVGYTPGYVYSYPYYGCVVYGTGWYYRPWYGHHYYPRPVTWGFGVHYSPWTGWGFSYGVSYGWLHIGVGVWRPPYYGWWGPAGYRHGYRHGYHHGYRAGYYHGRQAGYVAGYKSGKRQNNVNNLYRQRPAGVKNTVDRRPEAATRPARDLNGKQLNNNVFADQNGNIHRRTDSGWQERKNGQWQNSDRSAKPAVTKDRSATARPVKPEINDRQKNLDKAARDRQVGQQRSRDFQKTRSTPKQQKPAARPAGRKR